MKKLAVEVVRARYASFASDAHALDVCVGPTIPKPRLFYRQSAISSDEGRDYFEICARRGLSKIVGWIVLSADERAKSLGKFNCLIMVTPRNLTSKCRQQEPTTLLFGGAREDLQ